MLRLPRIGWVLVVGLGETWERLAVLASVSGVRRLSMVPELTKIHYACVTTRIEDRTPSSVGTEGEFYVGLAPSLPVTVFLLCIVYNETPC